MTAEELKPICDMTVELVRLRQNECKHLCIENAAPEIFQRLLTAFEHRNEIAVSVDTDWSRQAMTSVEAMQRLMENSHNYGQQNQG